MISQESVSRWLRGQCQLGVSPSAMTWELGLKFKAEGLGFAGEGDVKVTALLKRLLASKRPQKKLPALLKRGLQWA